MRFHLTRRHFIASGLASFAQPALARARAYDLVAESAQVKFIFTLSGAPQTGTLPVETADIVVNTSDLARSRAEVTADIRKISSGLAFVTQAIKSPDLLDAGNHPIVRFRSTGIRLGAAGRISDGAQIAGELTLRGVTRPIMLEASLTRPAGTPPDDLSALYIRMNGTLSREAYGATGYPGLADDAVGLDIRAEMRARA
jgi:polyisoprenoid-binding protein YceI